MKLKENVENMISNALTRSSVKLLEGDKVESAYWLGRAMALEEIKNTLKCVQDIEMPSFNKMQDSEIPSFNKMMKSL